MKKLVLVLGLLLSTVAASPSSQPEPPRLIDVEFSHPVLDVENPPEPHEGPFVTVTTSEPAYVSMWLVNPVNERFAGATRAATTVWTADGSSAIAVMRLFETEEYESHTIGWDYFAGEWNIKRVVLWGETDAWLSGEDVAATGSDTRFVVGARPRPIELAAKAAGSDVELEVRSAARFYDPALDGRIILERRRPEGGWEVVVEDREDILEPVHRYVDKPTIAGVVPRVGDVRYRARMVNEIGASPEVERCVALRGSVPVLASCS